MEFGIAFCFDFDLYQLTQPPAPGQFWAGSLAELPTSGQPLLSAAGSLARLLYHLSLKYAQLGKNQQALGKSREINRA